MLLGSVYFLAYLIIYLLSHAVLARTAGLQAECDTAGSRLIGRFLESRRIPAVVKDAVARRGKGQCATLAFSSFPTFLTTYMLRHTVCQPTEHTIKHRLSWLIVPLCRSIMSSAML